MSPALDGPPEFPELRQTDKNMTPRGETFWREHQVWLESCGYMLRPRYRPGWEPSWLTSGKNPRSCEDGLTLVSSLIDHFLFFVNSGCRQKPSLMMLSVYPMDPM